MRKNHIIIIGVLVAFLIPSKMLFSQSWSELMDSTTSNYEKQNFNSSLNWCKKALAAAEKKSVEPDSSLYFTLFKIADIYDNLGKLDSAFHYFDLSLQICRILYKTDNSELASAIYNVGDMYKALGRLREAETYFTECYEMRKRLFKGAHPDVAACISQLAITKKNLGKLQEAEPLYIEAYEMSKRIFKGDNPILANSINNLAVFYYVQGRYKEAEPLYEEALKMNRRLYQKDDPSLANSINNVAFIYADVGRYDESEALYKEAIAMYKRMYAQDNPKLAQTMQSFASLKIKMGKYNEAELLYNESFEMFKRLFKGDHPYLSLGLGHMANLYMELGRGKEAIGLFREALEMDKRIYQGDHQNLALDYNNLAAILTDQGRYKEAEPLYKETIEMNKRLYKGSHPYVAISLGNLGSLYKDEGNFSEAESYMKQSIEMFRVTYKTNVEQLEAGLSNLANLYADQGKVTEAEKILVELVDSARIKYKNGHQNLARILNNLASLYEQLDKLNEAESLRKEALEINRKLFKSDHPGLASTINNLAGCYMKEKKFADAEPLFKESLGMRKKLYGENHKDVAFNYGIMGYFYEAKGDLNSAEIYNINALESFKGMYLFNYSILTEKEKEKFWGNIKGNFEVFNSFGIKRMKTHPMILCNMYDNQLFTKALLFNSSNKIKSRIMNSENDTLREKFREWISLKEYLVKLFTYTKTQLDKQKINLDSLTGRANVLEKELNDKSELFSESYEKKKISWRNIQGMLKPDEAAIEITRFRGDNRKFLNQDKDSIYYAALIITDQTTEHPELVLMENGKELETSGYERYRDNIKSTTKDNESFKNYWSKIDEKLKGVKKIYFSPDGIYHKLNPETFLRPNGRFLFEDQEILILNSTKDIVTSYFKSKQESNMINNAELFGNPRFEMNKNEQKKFEKKLKSDKPESIASMRNEPLRGMKIVSLPGTENEIKNVENFLKTKNWVVNTHIGPNALKVSVKSVKSPRVLHLATHGIFLPDVILEQDKIFGFDTKRFVDNPLLRSGLLFTGASNYINDTNFVTRDDDNGVLTAYEAMNLELDHTELVVLSACETGIGVVQNGEGVYGLQRAFQTAGAKSVLMSLWTVADQPTYELMTSFYNYWTSGMTKRDAFTKAQKGIFNKYKNPYYWGAFVMVGE